ncbi:MAG: hypothetical protein HYY58_03015 [Candidatus Omnitrophica bacterium]|nr:hypothetical protein [Candidatus Omnitrophota bacterium]
MICLTMLSGCKIEFEANTIVSPDGSVTRTTRYIGGGAEDGELKTRYELPSGGAWKEGKTTRYDYSAKKDVEVTTDVYEVTKRYAGGEPIPSDFVRKAEASDRTARNQIRMAVQNYGFVKMFNYEERFRDIVTTERFEAAARKLYAGWVEHFAGHLAEESHDSISPAQAREKLKAAFDPLLVMFLSGLRREGKAFGESKTFKDELEPSLQEERIVAEVVGIFPSPSAEQADAWREGITRAFSKANDMLSNWWDDTPLEEELFGVHGFHLFQDYGFEVTLSLPGRVVESNATKREGGVLKWEFDNDDFVLEDYVIHARSRLVYSDRIAVVGGTLFVLLVVLSIATLRRRKRTAAR